MVQVFWIPIGLIASGVLLGAWIGGTHRSSSARSGALIGLYLAAMLSFPLLAIGFANT